MPCMQACKLEKDVNINLPYYAPQLAIECYLDPGKPVAAYYSSTASYFDSLGKPFVNTGKIIIREPDYNDTLKYNPYYDVVSHKLYNFSISDYFYPKVNATYYMHGYDNTGRHVSGTAIFLPKPAIDTLTYYTLPPGDTTVNLTLYIKDDPKASNYYRVILNRDTLESTEKTDQIISDGNFVQGSSIPVFSGGKFAIGDVVYVRVFNIEKKYYDYLRSTRAAISANGNPFAQPAVVKSTVDTGFGVFTCLSYQRKAYKLKK